MKKKFPQRDSNPNTKPTPFQPHEMPSTDSRDGHGLSEDETLKSKK